MKTLDEVIIAMENCYGPDAECCDKCQYTKKNSAGSICLKCNLEDDALIYLKAYRDDRDDLTALRAFWKEQQENPPLTWDELRTMGGKPVWVESSDSFNRRRWMFVGEWFDDDEMRLFDMGYDYPDYVSKNGYESGTWQAYRKERTDGQQDRRTL